MGVLHMLRAGGETGTVAPWGSRKALFASRCGLNCAGIGTEEGIGVGSVACVSLMLTGKDLLSLLDTGVMTSRGVTALGLGVGVLLHGAEEEGEPIFDGLPVKVLLLFFVP